PAPCRMKLDCPVSVATRASIDWPHWPTKTRSSMAPLRSGPKMSSQGCGKEPSPLRNVFGTGAQDKAAPEPFSRPPGLLRSGPAGRPCAIVKYLLSEPLTSCHDISREGDCKRAQRKRRHHRNKVGRGAFFSGRCGFAVGATQRRVCVKWLGVERRVCLARPNKSQ